MSKTKTTLFFSVNFVLIISVISVRYEPNWKSIDSRPLPEWYDKSKIGIFLHLGVFSVPAFGDAWFWWNWKEKNISDYVNFMKKNYPPDFTYSDFAAEFGAEFYNPDKWVDIFKASGARYVVLVSKHHEGYTLWPSKYSWNWNAFDVGPHRDLVGDLADALRNKTDLHFGMYHSLFEFFNPLFLQDQANNFATNEFVQRKTMPELYEMVNRYKPEIVWSDGDFSATDKYWNSTIFLSWLYNDSPVKDTVVTNDRWGIGTACKHGGFYNCGDEYNPGQIQPHKWENAMVIDTQSWGYRKNATLHDLLTIEDIIAILIKTVSCGGNLLINVGPTADGTITPIFEERLRQMGQWLDTNGEAIYESEPWFKAQDNVTNTVWYTTKNSSNGKVVYATMLAWPQYENNRCILSLGVPTPNSGTTIQMIGYNGYFQYSPRQGGGIDVEFPAIPFNKIPNTWAWVLKMVGLKNS